ncbi:MAG: EAL domain-containing protein [Granulosicoccus sp.]
MNPSAQKLSHGQLALIVDDEDMARMVATRVLTKAGFEVREASDGESALELLNELRPSVILLDVEMDRMDGFTVCEKIRQMAQFANTPIIMLTSHDDAESIDRAYLAGATDFASKPINWTLLRHRLLYVIRGAEVVTELASAQRIARMGSWRWTIAEGITRWSEGLQQVSGVELPVDSDLLSIVHPDDRAQLEHGLRKARSKEPMYLTHRILQSDGSSKVVEHRAEPIISHSGEVVGLMGTVHDVTEREATLERIHQLAYCDEVTALPNRRAFRRQLDVAIAQAHKKQHMLAVLYLDIDDFKLVNDSLGHSTGDLLLRSIGERLQEAVRPTDASAKMCDTPNGTPTGGNEEGPAARLGGDEFAVLLSSIKHPRDAEAVADRILKLLRRPIVVNGRNLIASPSIGIAIYPRDATDSESLLNNADTAMYAAKRTGKNSCRCYDSTLSESAQRRMLIETHLRGALDNDELSLHYQPQICVATSSVVGAEALLRWNSQELGSVGPVEFIPVAEDTGLVLPVGEWVLRTACQQLIEWRSSGIAVPRIAVNISMRQFNQSNFVERVASILDDTGMQRSSLELEITESMLAEDVHKAIEKLQDLKALGIALSIDDFGTGYSSLSYLKKFPIDRLKIDQSFIKDIDHDESDVAITTSIIGMARGLELGVVAEGVESAGHLSKLAELGCDEAQGYLLTKPLAAGDFVEWFKEYEARQPLALLKKSA